MSLLAKQVPYLSCHSPIVATLLACVDFIDPCLYFAGFGSNSGAVRREGFEPPNSERTDLQSACFIHLA